MSRIKSKSKKELHIDPSLYDVSYFLGECEGYEEFLSTAGEALSRRLATSLTYASLLPGMRVLDVGCGRGESLVWLAKRGIEVWGLDYSPVALHLAADAIRKAENSGPRILLAADARHLPFKSESFDCVLMFDIVEHLYPRELEQALNHVHRVLKWGGKLIIHTAPNLWYYKYGYPLYRIFEYLRGVRLPRDPRERFRYHRLVHVNEQSPRSLAITLRQAGFLPRVWVEDIQQRWMSGDRLSSILGWFVTHSFTLKWLFCGDILAEGQKVKV
jgi:cyclopropane fatty-acyl-phospholipid synthase-like methyltransferase